AFLSQCFLRLRRAGAMGSTKVLVGDRHIWRKPGTIPMVKHSGGSILDENLWITLFQVCQRSWANLEQNCLALSGNLASVQSFLKYQSMQALIQDTTGQLPRTCVGGFDAVKEGTWMWSDWSRFYYTNRNTSEPNNTGVGKDCLEMNAASEKRWFDVPCEFVFASLCSRRM
uniref:C-type lectin domain-containing protein n=1 Tax=Salmo trutta TaxID=8032 RepID=A0A674A3G4_SALTR